MLLYHRHEMLPYYFTEGYIVVKLYKCIQQKIFAFSVKTFLQLYDVVVDIFCILVLKLHMQLGIDGGGIMPIHTVGAYKGAPQCGHAPTGVYMIIYPFYVLQSVFFV